MDDEMSITLILSSLVGCFFPRVGFLILLVGAIVTSG